MENQSPSPVSHWTRSIFVPVAVLALALVGAGGYQYYRLSARNTANEQKILDLAGQLGVATSSLATATAALAAERAINASFASQVGQIQGTVATLDKLSKTDPELLRRYSQVYFLPDNYVPAALAPIEEKYLSDQKTAEQIQAGVWPHLRALLDAASSSQAPLLVSSAYRSFGEQGSLKTNYQIVYGTGANKFSADQGYSEHQLGTAVDLTTAKLGSLLTGFDQTGSYTWLTQNAYRYGFILSYPEKNGYFQYEPWHWRFVGVKLATYLHNENKLFYTLPQREINTYLINLFD